MERRSIKIVICFLLATITRIRFILIILCTLKAPPIATPQMSASFAMNALGAKNATRQAFLKIAMIAKMLLPPKIVQTAKIALDA
jgi:hypothetical protein